MNRIPSAVQKYGNIMRGESRPKEFDLSCIKLIHTSNWQIITEVNQPESQRDDKTNDLNVANSRYQ